MTLKDIYRTVTSKAAQRTLLYAVLVAAASSVLYGIAAIGYLAFYHEYVPHRVRSTPVHLQYGPAFAQFSTAGGGAMMAAAAKTGLLQRLTHGYHAPHGLADLRQMALKADQEYDVSIVLSLPHSPANLAVGNFMVELVMSSGPSKSAAAAEIASAVRLPPANAREFLESQGKRVLFAAARPAILAYTDPLVAQAKRIALLPVHFFAPEAASRERLIVPMAESLVFSGSDSLGLPAVLYMELRTPGVGSDSAYELQTYGAEVVFAARLRGLRWLMYHHRVFAFLLLTTVSWMVEVAFMAGVVVLLGMILARDAPDTGKGNGNGNGWEASTANSSRTPSMSRPASVPAAIKKEEKEDRQLGDVQSMGSAVKKEKERQDDRAESEARISSMIAKTAPTSPGSDDDDSDDNDDIYEDDIEPVSPSLKGKKTSQIPQQSPKKAVSKDVADSAVATGRASGTSTDNAVRQRQQQQASQSQLQTPKKEAPGVVVSSPVMLGKENSMRKKAAVVHDSKPAKPL